MTPARTVILTLAATLAACSTPPITGSAAVREVEVDGVIVWLAPMPDPASWGATRYRVPPFLPPNPATETALLVRAVEKGTGCKVVQSQFARESSNLYVTVECK